MQPTTLRRPARQKQIATRKPMRQIPYKERAKLEHKERKQIEHKELPKIEHDDRPEEDKALETLLKIIGEW